MTCLILADQQDLHADLVCEKIYSRGISFHRIDPFLGDAVIHFDSFNPDIFFINNECVRFNDVTGIYCRIALEALSINSASALERFSFEEYISALTGILVQVEESLWMNSPWKESRTEGKISILKCAKKFNLVIPRFIVTNFPSKVKKDNFINEAIIKPISDCGVALQKGVYTDSPTIEPYSAPFTSKLNWEELYSRLDVIEDIPFLVQDRIIVRQEIRCVCVDNLIFASASDPCDANNDIRLQPRINEVVYVLPEDLQIRIVNFVKEIGLRFATLDILLDFNGEYWLVDVNPSGNWLWQETELNLGISNAISHSLQKIC